MASTPSDDRTRTVDPAADLELLARARSEADIDQFLDFGPWWYAPLLATMIGGLTLFGRGFDTVGSLLILAVALTAGGIVGAHDRRRRAVRLRPTRRGLGFLLIMIAFLWALMAAWGTAASSIDWDTSVPGYAAIGWALTTLTLLAVRTLLDVVRQRRMPIQ